MAHFAGAMAPRTMTAAAPSPGRLRRMGWVLAVAVPLFAGALYAWRGEPALMLADVPDAGDESPQALALLQAHLERRPDDARALVHMARADRNAGRFAAASARYARALAARSKAGQDATVWFEYAETLALAQDGVLAGRPREALDTALGLNANHPGALDLAGSAALEAGDRATALRHWRRLLTLLPPDSRRHAELTQAIEREQQRLPFAAAPGR